VSRRFVTATETALAELMSRDLVAFMVDGVHFGEHTCVVALGIGIGGVKHPSTWRRARPSTPPWSRT
jgi:putative transposase